MATQVRTIVQILDELNSGKPTRPWKPIEGIYSISETNIDHAKKTANAITTVLVLKGFINQDTAEVRFHLAKWTDEPETRDLI